MLCRTGVREDKSGPSVSEMRTMLENQHRQDFFPGKIAKDQLCEECRVDRTDFWTRYNGKMICRACLGLKEDRLGV